MARCSKESAQNSEIWNLEQSPGSAGAMAPRSRWVSLLHCSIFTQALMQLFCLASIPEHKNEGQKQEPDSPAQSLAEIIFLQLRKFTLTQPRQVMETRWSRPPSLLALSVSQLLSCFYPPASSLLSCWHLAPELSLDRKWDADVWRWFLGWDVRQAGLGSSQISVMRNLYCAQSVANARVFTKARLEKTLKSKEFKEQIFPFSSEEFNSQASRYSWQKDWKSWYMQTDAGMCKIHKVVTCRHKDYNTNILMFVLAKVGMPV